MFWTLTFTKQMYLSFWFPYLPQVGLTVGVRWSEHHLPVCQHCVCGSRGPRPRWIRGSDMEPCPGSSSGQRLPLHLGRSVSGCFAVAPDATLAIHQSLPDQQGVLNFNSHSDKIRPCSGLQLQTHLTDIKISLLCMINSVPSVKTQYLLWLWRSLVKSEKITYMTSVWHHWVLHVYLTTALWKM